MEPLLDFCNDNNFSWFSSKLTGHSFLIFPGLLPHWSPYFIPFIFRCIAIHFFSFLFFFHYHPFLVHIYSLFSSSSTITIHLKFPNMYLVFNFLFQFGTQIFRLPYSAYLFGSYKHLIELGVCISFLLNCSLITTPLSSSSITCI